MNSVSTSPFNLSMLRKFNVWYTVKDGNWNDPVIWMSNGSKRHNVPQPGDDVYINHSVNFNVSATVKNIYISGTLSNGSGLTLTVNGDLQSTGVLDFTSSTINVILNGYNTQVTNLTPGNSTFLYQATGDQRIAPALYNNLTLGGAGTKSIFANLVTTGNFNVASGIFEAGVFNVTVGGTTAIAQDGVTRFSKTGGGSIIFIGQFLNNGLITLSGNPNLEFRGGITFNKFFTQNFGTGALSFTTNNQNVQNASGSNIGDLNNAVTIVGAITITIVSTTNQPIQFTNGIDGTVSGSTLAVAGPIIFISTIMMPTAGSITFTNTANVIYQLATSFTLPSNLAICDVTVGGSGTYAFGSNFALKALTVKDTAILDLGTYNLSTTGAVSIGGHGISKTGGGSILFGGVVNVSNGGTISFTGNPTLEFRGGLNLNGAISTNWGSGDFNFTTNNQILSNNSQTNTATVSNNIVITGAITLTVTLGAIALPIILTGTLNGTISTSIFDNRALTSFNYKNAAAPMVTGKLYCNQATNTFIYGLAGNQDIQTPSDPATPGYKNLTLNGSGAKKLLGNVSVKGTYTLTAPATLDSNGFALTNP